MACYIRHCETGQYLKEVGMYNFCTWTENLEEAMVFEDLAAEEDFRGMNCPAENAQPYEV